MSNLIILIGAPGSGKTYVAEKFSAEHDYTHINSDTVRAKYFGPPEYTEEERERVYAKIYHVIDETLSAGKNVIFDGNLLTNEVRFKALNHYQNMGIKVLFVFLNISSEIAMERALARKTSGSGLYNKMPATWAKSMHKTFEQPDIRLPQVAITNTDNYANVDALIMSAISV
jgi:predicted kinase